jgi:hypothetical protein
MEEKRKHVVKVAVAIVPIVCTLAIFLLLSFTNPSAAGPPGILAFFLLLYLLVATLAYLVVKVVSYLSASILKKSVTNRQSIYISFVVALGPVLLIALNTLGNVGLVELSLVCLLVILGCFYVTRRVTSD